jgi:hypothetical protein
MSGLSIYETRWINLVFENRNKEYGAYRLRQESAKTSAVAFLTGMLFLAAVVTIPVAVNYLNPESKIELPDFTNRIIQLSDSTPFESKKIEKPVLPEAKQQTKQAVLQKDQLVNPIVVTATTPTAVIAKNIENTGTTTSTNDGTTSIGINNATSSGNTVAPITTDTGNTVVTTVALDKLPEFPGGINKFYNYVGNNFEKTEIDSEQAIRIYVSFVIEKDGTMTDIQVKKDPGYGLGKEAIRVLKSLKTKWSPGMIAGKAVRTAYNLPITIQMN